MSEDATQADAAARAGPQAGERLAEARRLRKISLPDIARELHLDEPKVQALEENRFEVLGAPVFAKGHLRKYAEIVGISSEDVIDDYRALTTADIAPPVVGEVRQRPPRDINLGPWLIAIPLFLIVLGAAYWWLGRTPAPAAPAATPPVTQLPASGRQRLPPVAQTVEEDVDEAAPAMQDDELAAPADFPSLAVATEVADNAAPPAPAPTVAGRVDLMLTYSGDCWTEVTDASGTRLFFDLGRNGRTVRLSGTAPLRVLLGDSTNVRLTVNGAAYTIENAEFRGDTARLTINE